MRCLLLTIVLFGLALSQTLLAPSIASAQQQWGKEIKGTVVFGGNAPPPPVQLQVNDPACLIKGPIFSPEWLVNSKNLGVKDVFVWLEPAVAAVAMPIHPNQQQIQKQEVEMDQPCCMFEPHCLVMRQGQVLVAKNSAAINHNFRWVGHPAKNAGGNILLTPKTSYKIKDLAADSFPILVGCDVHKWMSAYIRVFDHPYFALTDDNGAFSIAEPPAGNYKLKVWHPASGWLGGPKGKAGTPLMINAGGVTDVGKLVINKT